MPDALAWQLLGFSALRRFEAEGRKAEDLALVHYALHYALAQVQDQTVELKPMRSAAGDKEVVVGVERAALGLGPAALARQLLDRVHVDGVDVGALLAVDLDGDVVAIEVLGDLRVLDAVLAQGHPPGRGVDGCGGGFA